MTNILGVHPITKGSTKLPEFSVCCASYFSFCLGRWGRPGCGAFQERFWCLGGGGLFFDSRSGPIFLPAKHGVLKSGLTTMTDGCCHQEKTTARI